MVSSCTIFDFDGRQEASSAEELHQALSRRFDGGNHFEIAALDRTYPLLDLMVSGDVAVVHHFAAESHAVAQSIGDLGNAGRPPSFLRTEPAPRSQCRGSTVVCMITAMRCAEEFSIDLQRPTAVNWFELEAEPASRPLKRGNLEYSGRMSAPRSDQLGRSAHRKATVQRAPPGVHLLCHTYSTQPLGGDEFEGTVAAGGDLTFTTNYNVAAKLSNTFTTPTAPGDDQPIGLHVGGGITWPANDSILRVLNQQFTKVVGTASYTAHVTDANGALSNYRLTEVDDTYDSTPRVEGTSNQQTIESIQTPYEDIDFTAAFTATGR